VFMLRCDRGIYFPVDTKWHWNPGVNFCRIWAHCILLSSIIYHPPYPRALKFTFYCLLPLPYADIFPVNNFLRHECWSCEYSFLQESLCSWKNQFNPFTALGQKIRVLG